jgi:hypothetical protein
MEGDELTERLKDAAYTAVGLGILGVQRLQVRRRDLSRTVRPQVREVAARLESAASAADDALDPVLERFEGRLPDATRDLVHTARSAVTSARDAALARAAGRH